MTEQQGVDLIAAVQLLHSDLAFLSLACQWLFLGVMASFFAVLVDMLIHIHDCR